MNNEGLIYLNTNLKIHALKIDFLKKLQNYSHQLLESCLQCADDTCVQDIQSRYNQFVLKKEQVKQLIDKKEEKYVYNYILCGDLIFDNDIKVCRRKIKEQFL